MMTPLPFDSARSRLSYFKENCFASMPTEVLLKIFDNLESVDLCQLRLVNHRIQNVIDNAIELDSKFDTRKASRFTITYNLEKKCFVMHSLKYGTKPSIKTLTFTQNDICQGKYFDFIFRSLSISRLHFEGIPNGYLDDNLMTYLLDHFMSCRNFAITSLTFHGCDMRNFSFSGMKQLLQCCKNDLKLFSLTDIQNAREDTFTDEHVETLNLSQINSLKVAKISMKPGHKYLNITDSFFYQLISVDAFPALMLQLCLVSTNGLTSYLKKWIKVHDTDSFSNITCTLKECPGLSQEALLNECEDLPIQISNYNKCFISIFIEEHPMNIFCINFGGNENSKQINFAFLKNSKSTKSVEKVKKTIK